MSSNFNAPTGPILVAGDPEYTAPTGYYIKAIYNHGYESSFAARRQGNDAGGKYDYAVAGVYGNDDAKCLNSFFPVYEGAWDKVRIHSTTSANLELDLASK